MSSDMHIFLFASLDSRQPLTARKVHLRRLFDVLELSIQRQDFERAKRAWAILARCKEIAWKALWTTGLHILSLNDATERRIENCVEYLRTMMLQYPDDRESILKELVFRLLLQGRCREALDELELYLPSFPYQDNPILHTYAGLSSLYLAQGDIASHVTKFDPILMRDAQAHLEHAKTLDENNTITKTFLDRITTLQKGREDIQDESDDESMATDDTPPERKRLKT
ncbi:hypothetical protein BDN70DRAFT_933609 [Pholiota conissans]|uniref:Uncharacterized protein n=1 Tax=Pholiota conissans TaxID=109636 RepID=A0A9P5YZN7_9AGAR|nr:hypothetical protein BDN70DRAFT_933609 [Pholiota conissans]